MNRWNQAIRRSWASIGFIAATAQAGQAQSVLVPGFEVRAGALVASPSIDEPYGILDMTSAFVVSGAARLYQAPSAAWGVRIAADALVDIHGIEYNADGTGETEHLHGGFLDFLSVDGMGRVTHGRLGQLDGFVGASFRNSVQPGDCISLRDPCVFGYPALGATGRLHTGIRASAARFPGGVVELSAYTGRDRGRLHSDVFLLLGFGT